LNTATSSDQHPTGRPYRGYRARCCASRKK